MIPGALAAALVVLALSALAGPARASCERKSEDVLQDMTARFVERRLDAAAASSLLGTSGQSGLQEGAWVVRGPPGCTQRIVLPAPGRPDEGRHAELRLPSGAELQLSALQQLWGPGTTVHESKTSSVMFRIPAADGTPVDAYVQLATRRVVPAATVRRVLLRRAG